MAKKRITRRTFVGNVAAGAAFTIVPRHVLGRGFKAPSDTLNIACIGCGGKGRSDIDGVATENIDAVTVSVPDHSHAAAGTLAMKLGKHAFIQKPLARTLGEVRALAAAARKYKVATQMGNQGHAREGTRVIRELVEAGAIGTVKEIRFWTNRPWWPQGIDRPLERFDAPQTLDWNLWLGPAPERPYNPAYAPFKWRGWWDFGTGTLGDMACHIMDAAFW